MKTTVALLLSVCFQLTVFAQSPDTSRIYFLFDSASLTTSAQATLNDFITAYRRSGQGSAIVLHGFCDTIGSYTYNDRLSRARVAAVQGFLLQHSVLPTAITTLKGYGKRQPVNANHTPQERQLNRRVDIIWTPAPVTIAAPVTPVAKPEEEPGDTTPVFSKTVLDSLKQGQTIRLRNINFYGGRHTFLPQARPALEELLSVMRSYPNLVIEIQGHICCLFTGYDADDFDAGDSHLSRNRAKAVYDFLREGGIAKGRMSYRGFAGSQPLVYPERSETDRTLNRRVEIRIVRK